MDRSDEIAELRDRRSELQKEATSLMREGDGVPPFRTWATELGYAFGNLLEDPDEDSEVDRLKTEIAHLEEYISNYS